MGSDSISAVDSGVIEEVLVSAYGITPARVERLKSVYRVESSGGHCFVLKPIRQPNEHRIAALHALIHTLLGHGLRAAPPFPTKQNRFLVSLGGNEWAYLQPALPGRHADFTDARQRLNSVAAAGYLHRIGSSRAFPALSTPPGLPLLQKLETKRKVFRSLLPKASIHCEQLHSITAGMQVGLALWSRQDTASAAALPLTRICHRDLAPHNLLVHPAEPGAALIDFDLAGYDHPFLDIMQVANHSLALSGGTSGMYTDIVEVYRRVAGLSSLQEQWLWRLFAFPEVLVRAVIEWAKRDYEPGGVGSVQNAIEHERWRVQELAQECPVRLY